MVLSFPGAKVRGNESSIIYRGYPQLQFSSVNLPGILIPLSRPLQGFFKPGAAADGGSRGSDLPPAPAPSRMIHEICVNPSSFAWVKKGARG